ncbi:MAG TPA: GNAT family N-acetyltransferase [Edaphocola sp.]|nr:GNAT family N-acetyltransferase [Edaphocola sp.]
MQCFIEPNLQIQSLRQEDALEIFYSIDNQREYFSEFLPSVAKIVAVLETEMYVQSVLKDTKEGKSCVFVIRKNEHFAGLLSIRKTEKAAVEMGYWLRADFQGQGIAFKAVKYLCYYAFEELKIQEIRIKCVPENTMSKQIPIHLGFQLEGVESVRDEDIKNKFPIMEVYLLSKQVKVF